MPLKNMTAFFFAFLWFAAAAAYGEAIPPVRGHDAGSGPSVHARVPGTLTPGGPGLSNPEPAKGRFLVATPELKGSVFEQSVILLIDYSWDGTAGLIINKPAGAIASEIFPDIEELADNGEYIYLGGPVEVGHVHLLIRSGKRPAESREILQDIYLSASMDALKDAVKSREEGARFRMYAGYSGWAAGQLEQEILSGSWYVMEGEQDVVFSEIPSVVWKRLIRKRLPFFDTVFRDTDSVILPAGLLKQSVQFTN